MNNKEKINQIKRIFDNHNIKRTNYDDSFFIDIINSLGTEVKSELKNTSSKSKKKTSVNQTIRSEKMELMVNIEGICNELKGKTKHNRYAFSLDIRQLPRTVFLAETKLLIRSREFQKSDVIVFYDDTALRTGNRGFAITRDEVITNINGLFRVLRFQEMTDEPEYVTGHKKDAFRFHLDDKNFDVKVRKNITYSGVVLDIFKILYRYAQIVKEENKRFRRKNSNYTQSI